MALSARLRDRGPRAREVKRAGEFKRGRNVSCVGAPPGRGRRVERLERAASVVVDREPGERFRPHGHRITAAGGVEAIHALRASTRARLEEEQFASRPRRADERLTALADVHQRDKVLPGAACDGLRPYLGLSVAAALRQPVADDQRKPRAVQLEGLN